MCGVHHTHLKETFFFLNILWPGFETLRPKKKPMNVVSTLECRHGHQAVVGGSGRHNSFYSALT